MIKLSDKTLKTINDVIEVGQLFNIGVFVIDQYGIRAKAEEAYIFLIKNADLDFLEFDSLCVNRVSEFKTRLKFMENTSGKGGFDIFAADTKTLDSGATIVSKLRMISDTTSVELTCDNGGKHDLPKHINDPDMVSFKLNQGSIDVLSKLPRAVQNKNKALNIELVNGVIVASSRDAHRDYLNHILSQSPVFEEEAGTTFSFMYNLNNIIPMLRGKTELDITLSIRGIMRTTLNGIRIDIFPEKLTD